jgi:hypothetical protein
MGAPTLTIKDELNYRRVKGKEKCLYCKHFRLPVIPGESSKYIGRCKIIGLDSGQEYKIFYHNVCDRYEKYGT